MLSLTKTLNKFFYQRDVIFLAGYKPKSLDDINRSYDSEMKVTRAIKRETSRLSQSAPSVAEVFSEPKEDKTDSSFNNTADLDNSKKIEDVSFAVEDFIKQISEQNPYGKKSKTTADSKHASQAPVIKTDGHPIHHSAHKEEPKAPASVSENQFISQINTSAPTQVIPDPSKGRSEDDFSNLMSDYVKIMNDLDDDTKPEKKGFMSRKKNKKKVLREEIVENDEDNLSQESAQQSDEQYRASENSNQSDVQDTASKGAIDDLEQSEPQDKPLSEENDNNSDNDGEYFNSFTDLFEDDEAESSDYEASDSLDENLDKDSSENEKAQRTKPDKKKKAKKSVKANKASIKKGHSGARIFFRIIFSLILVVSTLSTLAVGSMGIVFHINEGVSAPGNIYFFTASREFEQTGISSGDLVICKAKNSADDGQSVVYVDRDNKTFSFGVKNGSITGSDGEIYYIIDENTVMRENVLGSVDFTIPTVGSIIAMIYSYYIVVLVALLVLSIGLFLIVTVALRNRYKLSAEEEDDVDFDANEEDAESSEEEAENDTTEASESQTKD